MNPDIPNPPKEPAAGNPPSAPSFGRLLLLTLGVPLLNGAVNYGIFQYFRTAALHPILYALLAVLWGVAGIYLLFLSLNWVVEQYSDRARQKVQPYVFIGPAVALLGWLLLLPTLRTLYLSFLDAGSERFVGLANYAAVFTNRLLLVALRNNLLWVAAGTAACVGLGLLIAILADRSSFERTAKAIVFMPMAISFVAAGVIWKFIYYYQPEQEQIGLLNAVVVYFGGEPMAWTSMLQPWNNLFLIAILVWMQTGFAMVIFSAAIKSIPEDLLEAARVDGAGEVRIFFRIMIPYISSTLLAVTTTIIVFTLKIFDVVMVMTGGQYDTEVVATQFYRQFFMYRNFGYGSTLAIVLLIAVIPVLWFNLRQFRKEGGL
ncbi:carbohydrate ABC transporter permease [Paenibacillus mucilaginosus]|uniref:Binding-protein-dependent transport system inner membrane component n=3 Tax=Paenibacillus mucilaginosus TaxID=61624 RepID=H6NNS2_9BACL|nr:sugar ABC transporter permease [Paenibacillus mucilaginosus]AEI44486.1 binding-protein-dependent transport system inner membrane component [Paenibacillus mucilaginosus KNP414]AFC30448.1 binding-protein-dependent transport system inner membrane component [Paenibacillus mucilaginosus 3016]AFH62733.1 ABC transporter [Paenibacillus mucilaginosus K02]MCG7217513.1 sugar ABC transporter permease [Paenibacillus mucilaginosus]WDM30910.1 sugar ABC transporter permease [Paenibacillus mucilaginosus]